MGRRLSIALGLLGIGGIAAYFAWALPAPCGLNGEWNFCSQTGPQPDPTGTYVATVVAMIAIALAVGVLFSGLSRDRTRVAFGAGVFLGWVVAVLVLAGLGTQGTVIIEYPVVYAAIAIFFVVVRPWPVSLTWALIAVIALLARRRARVAQVGAR